jgi:TRAP-type C4-dicarboxylate transport system permease small subunit
MSDRASFPVRRFTAFLAVLCVLALGIFAASPGLHAQLHDTGDHSHAAVPLGDADHVCAVTLFANGLLGLALFCLFLLLAPLVREVLARAVDEVAATWPRYRLVPAQGPPAA